MNSIDAKGTHKNKYSQKKKMNSSRTKTKLGLRDDASSPKKYKKSNSKTMILTLPLIS